MGRPRDPNSTLSQVDTFVNGRKRTTASDLRAAFPQLENPHTLLTSLQRAGRVSRLERGVYGPPVTATPKPSKGRKRAAA